MTVTVKARNTARRTETCPDLIMRLRLNIVTISKPTPSNDVALQTGPRTRRAVITNMLCLKADGMAGEVVMVADPRGGRTTDVWRVTLTTTPSIVTSTTSVVMIFTTAGFGGG